MSELLDHHELSNLEGSSLFNNELQMEEEFDFYKKEKLSSHQGAINSAKSSTTKENKYFNISGKIQKKK